MHNLPEIEGIRRKSDHSGYVTPLGVLPPVTTVLSETEPADKRKALENWKRRTDPLTQKQGLKRGSWIHSATEHFHMTGEWLDHLAHGGYLRSMKGWIEHNIVEPIGMERPIYHPKGFSGTFDLLCYAAEWPELTLLDYKTSKRSKLGQEKYLASYKAQLGAYSLGLQWTYDVKPEKAVLCIGRPTGTEPEIVILDLDELEEMERTFLCRLEQYHQQLDQTERVA